MKRLFVASGVVIVLMSAAFLVFFTASKYRVDKQTYLSSLSDFVFMLHSYNMQIMGLDPPPLTPSRYERVMEHARRSAHREVRHRVVWTLKRWGDDVVPQLVNEIELPKREGSSAIRVDSIGLPFVYETGRSPRHVPSLWDRSLSKEKRNLVGTTCATRSPTSLASTTREPTWITQRHGFIWKMRPAGFSSIRGVPFCSRTME